MKAVIINISLYVATDDDKNMSDATNEVLKILPTAIHEKCSIAISGEGCKTGQVIGIGSRESWLREFDRVFSKQIWMSWKDLPDTGWIDEFIDLERHPYEVAKEAAEYVLNNQEEFL